MINAIVVEFIVSFLGHISNYKLVHKEITLTLTSHFLINEKIASADMNYHQGVAVES